MDTPTIDQIQTMPKEDLAALNRKLQGRLAVHIVGMIFLKLAANGVANVLVRKAIVVAAKRAA